MKTTKKLLAAGMAALFCCSVAKADSIIYSNNFALGSAVNISNTPPTVANTYAGGISSAVWHDIDGVNNTLGPLLANGVDTCGQIDYWALPFTPTNGYVYLLTVNLTFTNNPGIAPEFGFSQLFTTNYSSDARFNGSTSGYDWMAPTESSGNVQYFAGAKTANTIVSINNIFPANTPSTNTFQILLNTETTLWSVAGYCNGIQAGNSFTYTANPTGLVSVGISQNGTPSLPTAIQYNTFALTTTQMPFITTQPTAATTLGGGAAYTNSIKVMVDTNAGPLSYQWYANSVPLTNGVNNVVSGANSNVLIINPVETVNQLSNYYVIVSNTYGLATSSLASLTVLTNPTITTTGGAITLFEGSAGVEGSSPSFSVTAVGAPPLTYQWYTNNVAVSGATNNSLAFTNLQSSSLTSFTCIVSNSFGPTNVSWTATYSNAPTAAYPQAVLGDIPLDLWRLNEVDNGTGNEGVTCHDYQSGNNGVYTNATLSETGYDTLEPNETSLFVTSTGNQPSCVKLIQNVDPAAIYPNGVSAELTVEAWANCISANGGTGGSTVVSQGIFGSNTFFLGVDTNATKHYQFYVRSAGGTTYSADSAIQANDQNWHYLVGVCDQAHSNIYLYIDGVLATNTAIPTGVGLFESGLPVAIGAGIRSGSPDYNVPFTGYIDDVAIYTHALSIGQVINHFTAANNNTVPISFTTALPVTNWPYLANQTLTIPLAIAGSGSLSYYWSNLTTASLISSGETSNTTLNVSLIIPNASTSLNGDQVELVVSNSVSTSNLFFTLFNPPAPVALAYTNPILYSNVFNGGTWSIAGMPLTAANVLVGGTNTVWTDSIGTNETGEMMANGIPGTLQQDSWLLPFTPHAGYVYTINAGLTFYGNPGNWTGPGFAQSLVTNVTDGRFNGNVVGYDWMILTESSSNVQYFAGPATTTTITSSNNFFTPNIGTHIINVVLDTTGTNWKAYGSVDGKGTATNTYTTQPPIGAVGFAQNTLVALVNTNIQWDYFALTQVAPGGVPPYLLNPLPPTNYVLTNGGTVAISATAYGSAPLGYYWSNNATVIASGSTNTMSPLPASLSDPSSSFSAGPLVLVVTNAYGTNITTVTLVNGVNPNPGHILYSVSGNQLTLSWPTNQGWTLQTQTNNAPGGIGTNWVNVTNSTTTNQVTVTIVPTDGSVFYRLLLP